MKRLILVTASTGQPSTWPRVWMMLAAAAAGAVLLSLGAVLALAVILAAILLLLPMIAWRWLAVSRRAAGPVTIEGEYTIAGQSGEEHPGKAERPIAEMSRPSPRHRHFR